MPRMAARREPPRPRSVRGRLSLVV
jgi:hypothetical protein